MKSLPKSQLGKVGVGRTLLRITHLASRKSYLFIVCPIWHEKLTKSEIRQSHYVSLFGFIYSYFAPIYHFGPDLSLVDLYFLIFSFIYLYLPTFSLIWLYLPSIAIIWPYMPYSPYIDIILVKVHLNAKFWSNQTINHWDIAFKIMWP